jgi:GntR family transcriptional regulator, transcriptional repressor for pyruvate dehydrogenase complex
MNQYLADGVAEELLSRIAAEELRPHEPLPSEAEIARTSKVSRLTVREAIRTLCVQNVLTIRRGQGTFVNPTEEWTSFTAIRRAHYSGRGSNGLADSLLNSVLELRTLLEAGAAELAAVRRGENDLDLMRTSLHRMEQAEARGDVEALVSEDLAFHRTLLQSAGNAFLPGLAREMGYLLRAVRDERFALPAHRRQVMEHHQAVFMAVAKGDSAGARRAMESPPQAITTSIS